MCRKWTDQHHEVLDRQAAKEVRGAVLACKRPGSWNASLSALFELILLALLRPIGRQCTVQRALPPCRFLPQAEIIIKAGMQIFPNNAYVLILYSNLLIDVTESTQTGYSQLQAAKKCNPNIMERFAIFVREQVRLHAAKHPGVFAGMATATNAATVLVLRSCFPRRSTCSGPRAPKAVKAASTWCRTSSTSGTIST